MAAHTGPAPTMLTLTVLSTRPPPEDPEKGPHPPRTGPEQGPGSKGLRSYENFCTLVFTETLSLKRFQSKWQWIGCARGWARLFLNNIK